MLGELHKHLSMMVPWQVYHPTLTSSVVAVGWLAEKTTANSVTVKVGGGCLAFSAHGQVADVILGETKKSKVQGTGTVC